MLRFLISLVLGPSVLLVALVVMARSVDWAGPDGPYIFGTLMLGAIALFRDWLQPLFFPACLVLQITGNEQSFYITPLNISPSAQAYFWQIRIKNLGPAAARGVSVFLEKVELLPDGPRGRATSFPVMPLNLQWAHKTDSSFFPYIPPRLFRVCTLGHIADPFHGEYTLDSRAVLRKSLKPGATCFAFETEAAPTTGNHVLPPGEYRLRLVAAAKNSWKTSISCYLLVTGKWSEQSAQEMMVLLPWRSRPRQKADVGTHAYTRVKGTNSDSIQEG